MSLIGEALERLNVRPSQAATRLGISKGHIGDLISGRRTPSAPLALKIEREFGVSAATLHPTIAAALAAPARKRKAAA